jgi:hypothetical protein
MYTTVHSLISAKAGERVKITFTVTDRAGAAVSLSGASALYRIARRAGDAALLTLTSGAGITLSSNTAAVEFDTGDLEDLGDFLGQLTVTKAGDTLVVAEGPVSVAPVIA